MKPLRWVLAAVIVLASLMSAVGHVPMLYTYPPLMLSWFLLTLSVVEEVNNKRKTGETGCAGVTATIVMLAYTLLGFLLSSWRLIQHGLA
ncbi:hypothetical protein [Deinococcus arenae]|nr:hypothetical protein [Deinococcus arenae]AWT35751.1 hypothetical protein DM785_09410 [Deinococcus actinosclerus]